MTLYPKGFLMPKLTTPLSETEIRKARPREKEYKLYDTGGLRLAVRKSGNKVWQYPFILDGKSNIHTIGPWGNGPGKVGLKEARIKRDEVRDMLSQGINPNQHKKSQRQQTIQDNKLTFEAIGREWYSKQEWAEKHAKNILSRLEKDVFSTIGWKPVSEINIPDMMRVLKKIEERGALDVAKRINQYCTQIFEYAIVQGICENNPAMGRSRFVKSYTPKNRKHLKEDELPVFLEKLRTDKATLSTGTLATRLLVLTMLRQGELRGIQWDEVDLENKTITIPAERMKMSREHIVPLSRQAIQVIEDIAKVNGDKELLFPGQRRANKEITSEALIKVVKAYTGGKATPNGFRITASTILHEKDFNSAWIEKQLSHEDKNTIRGTYNKAQYMKDRADMLQWWADYLDGLTNE